MNCCANGSNLKAKEAKFKDLVAVRCAKSEIISVKSTCFVDESYSLQVCGIDHALLALWMKVKLKQLEQSKTIPRYQFKILASNEEIQEDYNVVVRDRFESLQEAEDGTVYWQQIIEMMTESAKEAIPTK